MKSIKIDDIANLQLKFDTSRFVNIDWSCNLNQEILKNLEIKLLNAKNTIETMDLILLSESIVSEVACFKRSKDKNNIVLDEEALNQQLFGNLRKPGGATYEKIKSYWILHGSSSISL